MTTNTTEQSTDSEKESLGAFRTSKALIRLYDHAVPYLSDAELKHIAGAVFHAEMEADHMTRITEALGCLIADDENNGAFDDLTPTLLWQISNHYDLLSGLIRIGQEADFRLNNPDKACPPRQQGKAL